MLVRLDEVDAVAVEVAEDGDGAVGFVAGRAFEDDALRGHAGVVAVEVVGGDEEEDAAAGLVADGGDLLGGGGLGEEQARPPGAGVGRGDDDPALAGAHVGVVAEGEADSTGVEVDRLVVVADGEGDEGESGARG